MKTAVYVLAFGLSATTAFAQGTIVFNNRVAGSIVTHIYGPVPSAPWLFQSGMGTADTPASAGEDWSAFPLLSGSGYTAELWAAPGLYQPKSSLVPATPTATFRTGLAAGFVVGTTATLPNVLPDSQGGATVALRVWDNQGGTITSWAMAQSGNFASGESPLFNITAPIGGTLSTPPNLVGMVSFNIHYAVPEPSPWALMVLGAALLVVWRLRSARAGA